MPIKLFGIKETVIIFYSSAQKYCLK